MNNLTSSIIAVLLLASPLVGAETEYPAADFQPKVLYKDSEYKSGAAVSKTATSESKSTASAQGDAQYPATNFQPKVLYKDDSYTPSSSISSTASSSKEEIRTRVNSEDAGSNQVVAADSESTQSGTGSKPNYLIALVVLGIVGFVFLKKRSKCASKKSSTKSGDVVYKNSGGMTGVSKYLNRVSGTGVARYIDKRVKSTTAATGVAKYVAKQVLTAKTTTKEATSSTGVEKYMRKRR